MGVLADIVARKRLRLDELRSRRRAPTLARRHAVDPVACLRRSPGDPLRMIAEIKLRSPSAGALSSALSVGDRGAIYADSGVAAISVLTDEDFFGGSFDDLAAVAARVDVPLLCKDFVLDRVQLELAAAAGASMVLLIVRLLDEASLVSLSLAARELGLVPFVEVASDEELARALAIDAPIVGVNARDLDTLVMDRERAARVLSTIPRDRIGVHLSGLRSPDDVRAVDPRADAALLGEALMKMDDPAPLLRQLVDSAGGPWRAR